MVSPTRRRDAAEYLQRRFKVSERRACKVVDQWRSTNRHKAASSEFEQRLLKRLHELASQHPQEGYKTIHGRLRLDGWMVNPKRIGRLWRLEGLQQPIRQASGKRAQGASENAVWQRRAEWPDHVWAYDFVTGRTSDGRAFRVLNIFDEFTREVVHCEIHRNIGSRRVQLVLAELFARKGRPGMIRSDNGRELIATELTSWIAGQGVECAFIEKGRPNQNGYVERFNGLMRRHVLDVEIFHSLLEARVVLGDWVTGYNTTRPHGAIGKIPPTTFRKRWKETLAPPVSHT